ncbi:hypothetical protein RHSIM_RhsimUnG0117900 [Rhododendron simsii]|uniref:Ribosomal protein L14 n=1 Tax=Rhododendron simsii TaxID=118357 RepID=A0A834FW74_RHOSS|nr:hypothetical protein RHSIM_RhsimUnG0117900 [Rhododendron simsii]
MKAAKEIEELKADLVAKETKLQSIFKENEGLSGDIEKNMWGESESLLEMEKKFEVGLADLKASLLDKENELQSIKEENESMKFEIRKREVEINEAKDEALASAESAKAAEREALMKLGFLTEAADKSIRKVARMIEQLDASQGANAEMEAVLRRLKVQSDQWRKAAEAAAAMLSTGNNNGKYVERTGSLDYHTIGGKLGSPLSKDLDDESLKKKNGGMFKKIGVMLKKDQKWSRYLAVNAIPTPTLVRFCIGFMIAETSCPWVFNSLAAGCAAAAVCDPPSDLSPEFQPQKGYNSRPKHGPLGGGSRVSSFLPRLPEDGQYSRGKASLLDKENELQSIEENESMKFEIRRWEVESKEVKDEALSSAESAKAAREQQRTFIQMRTKLKVVDNSGAKEIMCIQALKGGKKGARLGDLIVASVTEFQQPVKGKKDEKVKESQSADKGKKREVKKAELKKGSVVYAVVVRAAMQRGRCDGSEVKFDDNAAVLVNKQGEPIGKRVFGPIPHELRKKKHVKILSLAEHIV